MSGCNATKYDHPTDPMPMICARVLGHTGDHSPVSNGGVWATWADDEEVA